ncbi:MAG: hypothetical protein GPJ54_19815 [Candidatus Heimdallarchaeota archaeon]|nr:hypothetical protein [Candidatus Heimdallarchaeota archaeon]
MIREISDFLTEVNEMPKHGKIPFTTKIQDTGDRSRLTIPKPIKDLGDLQWKIKIKDNAAIWNIDEKAFANNPNMFRPHRIDREQMYVAFEISVDVKNLLGIPIENFYKYEELKQELMDRALLTLFDNDNLIETFQTLEDAFTEIYSHYIVDDTLKLDDQLIDFRFQSKDSYIEPGYNDETGEYVHLKKGKRNDGSTYLSEI